MTLGQQILWGSMYLSVCLFVELLALVIGTEIIVKATRRFGAHSNTRSLAVTLLISLFFIVLAHTVQAWVWAAAYIFTDAIQDWNTAVYFSLVSYSTLGYGDIVLGPGLRVFGSFSAVTGILAFGISTAYLVAVTSRALSSAISDEHFDGPLQQRRK